MEDNKILALVDWAISAERLHTLISQHLPEGISPFTVSDTGSRQHMHIMLIDLGENTQANMAFEIGYLVAMINRDTYEFLEKTD